MPTARESESLPAAERRALPLPIVAALLAAASVLAAAVLGFALALWWQPARPWMVALASAVGVLGTMLPLALLALGLARLNVTAPSEAAHTVPTPAPSGLHGVMLNHEQFTELVAREWSRARRYGTGAALLVVEIDRYERLVDALGESAGEKVLAQVMGSTALTLRGADALTRRAPGQMAIFLAHADATGALDVAERIRERAEQMEVALPPRRVRFTVSVGVAHLRPAHLHQQALLEDVADAVAAARTVGGNCVRAAPVELGPPAKPGSARDGFRADKR
jgi:diguanylate cyclase (GGDEF)-like protein